MSNELRAKHCPPKCVHAGVRGCGPKASPRCPPLARSRRHHERGERGALHTYERGALPRTTHLWTGVSEVPFNNSIFIIYCAYKANGGHVTRVACLCWCRL